jgi:hypothetical protein
LVIAAKGQGGPGETLLEFQVTDQSVVHIAQFFRDNYPAALDNCSSHQAI